MRIIIFWCKLNNCLLTVVRGFGYQLSQDVFHHLLGFGADFGFENFKIQEIGES